ncbi:hypothetical protein [Saccharopolyspora halophila]
MESWLPPTTQRPFGVAASPEIAPGAGRVLVIWSASGSKIVTPW